MNDKQNEVTQSADWIGEALRELFRSEERQAWDRYAAACKAGTSAMHAAEEADDMLAERRKRFPSP